MFDNPVSESAANADDEFSACAFDMFGLACLSDPSAGHLPEKERKKALSKKRRADAKAKAKKQGESQP